MMFLNTKIMKGRFVVGRRPVDRSNKVMQTFESTKPLTDRLKALAADKKCTVSAAIREILEKYFENREL